MKTKGLIIALFAMLATSTTFAQTTQTGVLEERIAKLEESNSKWSKIVEKLPTISGYTFIRYQYNDAASQTNTFDIRRARLSLSGKPAKWFEYKIQLEFASSPKIMDAYAKFKIDPMFNVQVGQMKIPPPDIRIFNKYRKIQIVLSYWEETEPCFMLYRIWQSGEYLFWGLTSAHLAF